MTKQEARQKGITIIGNKRHITLKEFAEELLEIAQKHGEKEMCSIGRLCGNGDWYIVNVMDTQRHVWECVAKIKEWKRLGE